jgi:hypothetical protein
VNPLSKACKNLKQKKDLGGINVLRYPKSMFIGAKKFMKVATKGDAFFIYTLPSLDVNHIHMRFFPNTKNSRMCLRKKCEHVAQASTIRQHH